MVDARVVSLGGNAANNSLKDYGLNFDNLNILNEYGLIIADYNSNFDYRICIANENSVVTAAFSYQNQLWGFRRLNTEHTNTNLKLSGVKLSRAGSELSSIVELQPDEQYTNALRNYFKGQSIEMIPITIRPGL